MARCEHWTWFKNVQSSAKYKRRRCKRSCRRWQNQRQRSFLWKDVDAVSTFNKKEARNNQYDKKIISENEISVLTMKDIFETYCKNSTVDFVSIDVEGDNRMVLEGNEWSLYRPSYILIEMPGEERLKIIPYLYQQGYYWIFDNSLNGIFADSGIKSAKPPISFEQCLVKHK